MEFFHHPRPFFVVMNSRRFFPILAAACTLGGALVWAKVSGSSLLLPPPPALSTARVRAPYDPSAVHKLLEFDAKQARSDPGNAIFGANLAAQYLESYRETGDAADATRAEAAARASLKIRTHGNSAAFFVLARALLTQHRFAEALVAARRASLGDPVGLRQCADIEIELGDYAAAARDINASQKLVEASAHEVALARGDARSAKPDEDPAVLTLVARLRELHGDTKGQLTLLTRAAQLADADADLPAATVAWFHERLGRCLFMTGRLDEARVQYRAGLSVFPRDYRTLAALAHLCAARGDWKGALDWGQKAANIVPAPETLALLGDAHAALGQSAQAAAQYKLVEQIGALGQAQGILYDRQRALYYADHDRNPAQAVALARGELRVRHDIYADDALAWTLCKAGRAGEAAPFAARALRFGTRDASLFFHAGMIAAALGDKAHARLNLTCALQVNPFFHPTQPATARAALAHLAAS